MMPDAGARALIDDIGPRLDGMPLLVLLDVDGTIVPIAPKPGDAALPAETRAVLERLMTRAGVSLALLSGRSVGDAKRIVGLDSAWFIGNHGLEVAEPHGDATPIADARTYAPAVQEAARLLAPLAQSIPGVIVEDKRWSLTVHYRLVSDERVPQIAERVAEVAQLTQLRVTEGRKIIELRPPVRVDKGTAAVDLARRLGALNGSASVFHAGDDRTDEDAFRALRRAMPRAVTVRILSHEGAAIETAAEFVLASPDELRQVLEWIADRRAPD